MPFIGTQPEVGGYSVLDALTASATASYTLQLNSANFVPASANQLLVSLNGVIQKPGSSFTVSGSTLTFSSALTSSDSIHLPVGTSSTSSVSLVDAVIENIQAGVCNLKNLTSPILQYIRVKFTNSGSAQLGKGKVEAAVHYRKRRER